MSATMQYGNPGVGPDPALVVHVARPDGLAACGTNPTYSKRLGMRVAPFPVPGPVTCERNGCRS
jgi:hypothetical protein